MSDKLTALPALTTAPQNSVLYLVDPATPTISNKITLANLAAILGIDANTDPSYLFLTRAVVQAITGGPGGNSHWISTSQGFTFAGAITEKVRNVNDAGSISLSASDCVLNYIRTDEADLDFGDPATQEGRKVLVCNNTDAEVIVGAGVLTSKFFLNTGALGSSVVDSVIMDPCQSMAFQVVNGLWRVLFYQ